MVILSFKIITLITKLSCVFNLNFKWFFSFRQQTIKRYIWKSKQIIKILWNLLWKFKFLIFLSLDVQGQFEFKLQIINFMKINQNQTFVVFKPTPFFTHRFWPLPPCPFSFWWCFTQRSMAVVFNVTAHQISLAWVWPNLLTATQLLWIWGSSTFAPIPPFATKIIHWRFL